MIVGTDWPQPAALYIPSDSADSKQVQKLFEELNASVPKHSRIVSDLVKPLPMDAEFIMSDKKSLKRAKTVAMFQQEIDDLYTGYEGTSSAGEVLTSLDSAKAVVLSVLSGVFPRKLKMEDNLFDLGMDSLAAIQTRNTFQRRIKLSKPLRPNIVFEHPTPSALAEHLWAHASGASTESADYYAEAIKMADQGKTAVARRDTKHGPVKTVLLSGASGSIGAHILHQLVHNIGITRVFCPVRAKTDADATERVDRSLRQRKLPSLHDLQANGSTIECFASDLSDPELGLASDMIDLLKSQVDSTIHCAWPVNFNLPLSSFAPHIKATINLLNLIPTSRFTFLSSVSAASRWTGTMAVPETTLPDPRVADNMGYAVSKWITELITDSAGGTIIRVGQVCGDSVHGVWNESEAVPAVIKAAQIMGTVPDQLPGGDNWILIDEAARAISILSTRAGQGERRSVYNLVNATSTPWSEIVGYLTRPKNLGSTFRVVPLSEWVETLRSAADKGEDVKSNPALKLVSWFSLLHTGPVMFDTTALRKDTAIRFQTVGEMDLDRMVEAWKESGFLNR